jgi:LmbE family N-acetylglucosaminyl deacetylase
MLRPTGPEATDLLRSLLIGDLDLEPGGVYVVAAHPDDEVIGAGSRLRPLARALTIVHSTDGAPADPRNARAAGFPTREAYARARRTELEAALGLTGIDPGQARCLSFVDQEAAHHLVDLTLRLLPLFVSSRPMFVLTHPYEGGHPDHDATAFAVHAARAWMAAHGIGPPIVCEFACYHAEGQRMRPLRFLPNHAREITIGLSPAEEALKKELFRCYATQARALGQFPTDIERFRVAPSYDFTAPPHEGPLHYERFAWSCSGEIFRERAAAALVELELGC